MKAKTNLLVVEILLAVVVKAVGQPVITNQPLSQTNVVGSVVTLSVGATGTPPLFYQWRRGVNLPGETNETLVLTNVQIANQGIYTVVVTSVEGAITSSPARLYVVTRPSITQHPMPTNQSVSVGADVTFTATAGSSPHVTTNYQWRRNDADVPGKTNATLLLTNAQVGDSGHYTLVVTNLAGAITSRVARLDVDPTFTKITTGNIVTDRNNYWNGSWADFDNDGYIDLFVGTWWNSQTNHLYRNNGDGTFTRVLAANIPKIPSNQHGATWGDYDNDGFVDLMVTAGNPEVGRNAIYRNNGNASFTAINNGPIYTETLGNGFHAPSWADYDNDGFLDLFIAGHAPQNRLFRNQGDGTFTRITNSAVVSDFGASEGRAWVDYDNDGDVDLFVCNLSPYTNTLHRNDGNGAFTKITTSGLTSGVDDSLACAWGDYDNDGHLDVFLANGYNNNGPSSLYKNNGDGTFTRITEGSIVNDRVAGQFFSSCAWGDYDNDGFLDLFVTAVRYSRSLTTCYLYHNNGDGTFTRITTGSPVNDLGNTPAASWVDYDYDGFLDLFVANGGFWAQNNGGALLTNQLYRNNGNRNAWVTIRLVGTVSNRSAIGAKVRVKAILRGQTTWQVRQIFGGDSQSNEQPLDAHFGLADATNIDLVRIEWPSGTVQELHNVATKRFLTATEPPRLSSPRIANEAFAFTLKGGRGFQYGIQRSTNAVDWAPVGLVSVTNFNGTATFSEPVGVNEPARLFRAVSP